MTNIKMVTFFFGDTVYNWSR